MENNRHMKLYSLLCLVNKKLMKLDSTDVWKITDKMELYYPGCMENNKQMELYSPWWMENNKQMELFSMGVW
jgi:hypothetical protein